MTTITTPTPSYFRLGNYRYYNTVEQGFDQLKQAVAIRNKLFGSYRHMITEDCKILGQELIRRGGDYTQVCNMLGETL